MSGLSIAFGLVFSSVFLSVHIMQNLYILLSWAHQHSPNRYCGFQKRAASLIIR